MTTSATPQLIDYAKEEKTWTFQVELAADCVYFEGHFEAFAILPAVAQIHIIDQLVREHVNATLQFAHMKQLKFVSPITPNTPLQIVVKEWKPQQFQFAFRSGDQAKSKGTLVYQKAGEA